MTNSRARSALAALAALAAAAAAAAPAAASAALDNTGDTASGASIAIVFSTDMNNPEKHEGFDLTYSGVYGGQQSCGEVWSCGDGYTCKDGFCERESNGSSNKNNKAFPPWLKWLLIALACLAGLEIMNS